MHKFALFTLSLVGLLVQQAIAQRDYSVYLQWGSIPVPEMQEPGIITNNELSPHQFKEHYYLVLQFDDVLNSAQQADLEVKGIDLLGYLPNYAYVVSAPTGTNWSKLGARALFTMKPEYKLAPKLLQGDYPDYALSSEGLKVQVYPYPGIALEILLESLKRNGFTGGTIHQKGIALTLDPNNLLALAQHPAVMYVEPVAAPPQPEGWNGVTSHRLNSLFNLGFSGSNVSMAIGDDGSVSHEDFRGRVTDFNDSDGGTHGDMTAGIAIGAGNLNPLGVGMAPGAYLYLYPIDNYPHIENAVQNLEQHRVVITSTSYGEGCGGVYNQSTQEIDQQVYQHPTLFHAFSAGNSGEENCSNYGNIVAPDGSRYGNITGGRKVGKNVITVGNAAYDDNVLLSSSRGPTLDGRIKPDIIALGQGNFTTDVSNGYRSGGGTSAASPALAGTAALLYEAYRNINGGNDPSSALIKAALLNTADDLENPGPDYITGWGRVNADRALQVLENHWYQNATVTSNATKTHTITIPQGTHQVRVMLYWHDPEGLPFAGKALVNDLDLTMNAPSGETYRPWVLSTIAKRDSLNKPAYRGTDRVNNVEQITIDEPTAGTYQINVKGYTVPRGPQEYYIVYYFLQDELKMTYPIGGEGFVPGEIETIHWDAFQNTGTFSLEYSTNNGANWQTIANNIAGDLRYYDWPVPNIVAPKVLIRVKRNGKSVASPKPFCIMALPDFNFKYIGQNTAAIYWRPVSGANVYDVYALGDKYMDKIGSTSDTSFNINIAAWQSDWFSVKARNTNGAVGRRANAKLYQQRPCEVHLTLKLTFDLYPAETYWDIKDNSGRVWASGGPYIGYSPGSTLDVDICLPYGCYTLNMYDTYNDGMCCQNGEGAYQLLDEGSNTLASGGQFTNFKANNFCVEENVATSNLALQVKNIQQVSCFGENNGAISVMASGGTGNYTYHWSQGGTASFINQLTAGTYSVTVSDGVSQLSTNVVISEPTPIDVEFAVQEGECNENNSTLIATASGGTSPYTYRWENGAHTSQVSNLNAGSYRITVTDAKGCTQEAVTNIQPASMLKVNITAKNISCYGMNDGSATAIVSGGAPPYTYAWSTGSANASATGLWAAIHSVTITDSRGCQITAAVNIITPPAIAVSYTVTPAFGTNNGAINASVSGGTPAYTFKWSNGATTENLAQLGPGTYTVTVTDSKGCTAVRSVRVEFQDPLGCSSRGSNTRFEWIESVKIDNELHTSGNNGGYADFTAVAQNLTAGTIYPFTLTAGYTSSIYGEFWRVWIDWNRDGDFLDDGEEVFASDNTSGAVNGNITIPANAVTGKTKLRVSMRYGSAALPCGIFPYGEVEDYTINITQNNVANNNELNNNNNLVLNNKQAVAAVTIFPNPTQGATTVRIVAAKDEWMQITLFDPSQRKIMQKDVNVVKGINELPLDSEQLTQGYYLVYIKSAEEYFVERLIIAK